MTTRLVGPEVPVLEETWEQLDGSTAPLGLGMALVREMPWTLVALVRAAALRAA